MNTLTKISRFLGLDSTSNPTLRFPELLPEFRLIYTFATRTLNGISYSTPLSSLAPFGRASKLRKFGGPDDLTIFYASLGLSITLDNEGVVYFEFDFSKDLVFPGSLNKRMPELYLATDDLLPTRLNRTTSSNQLDTLLGEPYDRFISDQSGELGKQYVVAGTHIATFHSADGTVLRYLNIGQSA